MLFVRLILVFFFFKQKTAYEMRISDWSSDVCSSDLPIFMRTNGVHTSIVVPAASEGIDWSPLLRAGHIDRPDLAGDYLAIGWGQRDFFLKTPTWADLRPGIALRALVGGGGSLIHVEHLRRPVADRDHRPVLVARSEEHTSELQSLMRISYAVFCLK